jgi:glycosyltransferase involved in cell wall biosynthesis
MRRLLLTADAVGGVWQYAIDLAAALFPCGFETSLAVLGPPPSPAQRAAVESVEGLQLIETGLALDWLARAPEELLLAGQELAALAGRIGADLVQINQPAIAAKAHFAVPTIAVAHSCLATWWEAVECGPLPEDFAWRVAAHGAGLRAADCVVAPSLSFADATMRTYDLRRPPKVVHNGRLLPPAPAAAMRDFGFTAGRLWDRGKNLVVLDRAAARLGVVIKAAGPLLGPHGERVAFDHLHTPGRMDDAAVAGCLAARPVFVSAACYEPFGLAALEAAVAGCALVLSDIPTFRELWGDAATFVSPDDHAGFAHAMEALIGDTRQRLAQGEKARLVARRYTVERMASEMAELYHQLLGQPARRAAA